MVLRQTKEKADWISEQYRNNKRQGKHDPAKLLEKKVERLIEAQSQMDDGLKTVGYPRGLKRLATLLLNTGAKLLSLIPGVNLKVAKKSSKKTIKKTLRFSERENLINDINSKLDKQQERVSLLQDTRLR